jgi:hypothetical protein
LRAAVGLAAARRKEPDMPSHGIDAPVLLTHDLPELGLFRGTGGVVRSTWFAPTVAYEVEFEPAHCCKVRALLLEHQICAAPQQVAPHGDA